MLLRSTWSVWQATSRVVTSSCKSKQEGKCALHLLPGIFPSGYHSRALSETLQELWFHSFSPASFESEPHPSQSGTLLLYLFALKGGSLGFMYTFKCVLSHSITGVCLASVGWGKFWRLGGTLKFTKFPALTFHSLAIQTQIMILDPVKYNFQHLLIIQAKINISINISTNSTVSIITENNYLFTCFYPS